MIAHLAPGSFYGQSHKRCDLGDLTFVESIYSPGFRIPEHSHAQAFFYLVLKGSCTETYENRTRSAGCSTLVFHPAGGSHADHWLGSGGRCFHIEIGQVTLRRASEHVPLLDHSVDFRSGDPIWLTTRLYREFQRGDDGLPLAMEGLVLELLAHTSGRRVGVREHRPPPWLVRARDLLHDRFAERLALDEIAGAVGVHPVHLCRVFRQQHGCTPGEYIRNLRVDFASRQLATSQESLAEIALAAGFADQSHFTKVFRRSTGMTPVEWRHHFRPR
jgi:AraC family transcriptional regulator